jgi:hypothetical protein
LPARPLSRVWFRCCAGRGPAPVLSVRSSQGHGPHGPVRNTNRFGPSLHLGQLKRPRCRGREECQRGGKRDRRTRIRSRVADVAKRSAVPESRTGNVRHERIRRLRIEDVHVHQEERATLVTESVPRLLRGLRMLGACRERHSRRKSPTGGWWQMDMVRLLLSIIRGVET